MPESRLAGLVTEEPTQPEQVSRLVVPEQLEQVSRLTDLTPEADVIDENRRRLLDKIIFDDLGDIVSQSDIAKELVASLDEPEDTQTKYENRIMLASLFDMPFADALIMEPGLIKELYGKPLEELSSAVINKSLKEDIVGAIKETPENLWIGTIGLSASILESIKRRAIQLSGGGVLPDEALKHQFEAVTPDLQPARGSVVDPTDMLEYLWRQDKLDFIRPRTGLPLPGAVAAEAFGAVTRLPDIGAKIVRSKQKELIEEQDIATLSNAPITRLTRTVVQSGVPSMGVAVGVSLLTGNPLIGLTMLGEMEGGAAFQKQLEEGSSVRKALIIGELSEAAEIGGEALVLPKLVRGLKEGISIRKGLTLVVENALQEGVTGFNQEFLSTFGTETTKGTDLELAAKKAFVAGYRAIPENAFVGGATAGLVDIAATPVNVARGRQAKKVEAKRLLDDIARQVEIDIATAEAPIPVTEKVVAEPELAEPPAVAPEEEIARPGEVAKPEIERKPLVEKEVTPEIKPEAPAVGVKKEVAEVGVEEKLPSKAPPVEPVKPVRVISPGEAGPLRVTLKAAEGVPATRIIVDPKVRRSIQAGENKLAVLKTKLKQAKADKKVAVIKATADQISKSEIQIAKLKERQQIKLTATIENAKAKVIKLKEAVKFKESLRRDAISMIRAIPKELQKDFINRASKVTTIEGVRRLADEIDKGIARVEKKSSIDNLRKAAKAINLKRMLPEFADTARKILGSIQIGKLRPDTVIQNADLKEMAQQVLDTAREDSVAVYQAQQLLDELREKAAKTFAINQLSIDAIDQITDTLIALRFQSEADTIAAKDENAAEAIRRRKEIKKSIVETPEVSESLGGKQLKKFKLFHDNLESALDAVSGARPGTYDLWAKAKRATTEFIYDVLNKGVDDQIIHNEKARNIFRQILNDNNVTQKDVLEWSMRPEDVSKVKKAFNIAPDPKSFKFTLQDARNKSVEFEFTVNELMSIFMHSRNSHNLSVLLNDGMDRTIKGKKQKIRGFTVEVIDDMIDSLTDQQKKVARQVSSKLMDGFNKDAINATSVRLEFFELAKVERYWSARRSIIRTPKGKQIAGAVKTVEGMGLLKERVGIGNPMRLSGFFETVYSTNKNVATYVGLAGPLREVKAVYTPDVIEELENNGRSEEAKLITDLIVRFEDQSALLGPLDTIIKRMLGGFAKAKLFLNIKIAPRQQISSFLISAYVDTKYITEFRGVATSEVIAEVNELSPQTKARFEKLQFDRDIGDAFVQNELMNYLTGETTLIDKTAIGMRFFDKNAIVDVYRATKAEVADKRPDIDINSKEGKALLKDRFEWVTRHTQPMWHPKDRSLIGSDPRPLIRSLTMFMSQREQLVRIVNNGVADYVNSEKTTEDATRLGRSIGSVALNMAAFTLYNFAWALLIHKKKRDIWDLGRSFLKDLLSLPFFGKYIAKSFEISFNALTDKPIFRQSFDEGPIEGILGEILIEAIPNFARAGKHFVTGEKYKAGPRRGEEKWKHELLVAADSLVDAIASLKGIPYYGAKDIVRTVKAQLTDEEKKKGKTIQF